MKITVKLFATLRDIAGKEVELEMNEDTTPKDILEHLGIPVEEAAIIMINGKGAKADSSLKDSDVIAFFPLVGGG